MKFISDNLLMLALAVVLGFSPLQTVTASVSKCMNMDQGMHHQMNVADKTMLNQHSDMAQSDSGDCCEQTACDMPHCASSTAAATTSNTQNDMAYTVSNVYLKPSVSLIAFYPSSLYRPPKI